MRVALAIVLIVLAVAARPCQGATERETHRFRPPLKPIDIRVTTGDVEIRATDRADVIIEIEREAADAAGLALIPADVADTEDTLVVNVTQREGQASAALRVRVIIDVPLLTTFKQVAVAEGRIVVHGLRGTIQARVERGSVEVDDIAGIVRLETTTGDIRVDRADLLPGGLLRLRTFSGAIRIGLVRAPRDARVLLLALRGTITSDLPLEERQGFGGRFREGMFGTAEPLLSADTVKGDIVLTVGK